MTWRNIYYSIILFIKTSKIGKAENVFRDTCICDKAIKNNEIMVNAKYRIMVYIERSVGWGE